MFLFSLQIHYLLIIIMYISYRGLLSSFVARVSFLTLVKLIKMCFSLGVVEQRQTDPPIHSDLHNQGSAHTYYNMDDGR